MPSDKMGKRANEAIRSVETQVDRLLETLGDDLVVEMVAIQSELARDPTVRCATRQRASAKIIDWKTELLAMKAKMALPDHSEDAEDRVKVMVVSSHDLERAQEIASERYLQRLKGER